MNICKIILVIINLYILGYLIILLIDHYNARHKFTSWASGFHVMSCLWLGIRGTFWLLTATSTTQWDAFTFYTLYWIPNTLEFGSFMLLPLFFAQIIYPTEWQQYWTYIRPIFSAILVVLVSIQVIWSLLAAYEEVIRK